ncbi:B98 [miniopterid betaherpesvirus 1]|uniref:B98 n=1 Tax=miniopterid betaherpesvirus 1 TaxID=3070189 RepID=I3VQ91_9BETA|nr:B98 [miniopterid betaherpesvirus 1]AFK83935.1 B98 [miniopterid betaherpesvirus 1]
MSCETVRVSLTGAMDEVTDDDVVKVMDVLSGEPMCLFLVDKFIASSKLASLPPFPVLRITYLYHILKKIKSLYNHIPCGDVFISLVCRFKEKLYPAVLGRSWCGSLETEDDGDEAHVDLSRVVATVSDRMLARLFKSLEAASRGQARNVLWHALRVDTISATKFYGVLMSGIASVADDSRFRGRFSDSVCFGTAHEPVVKTLLEFYVLHGREPVRGGLGLLIDPTSGLIGASVDLCSGIIGSRSDDELISVVSGASIFEIKCRYKFLRRRDDRLVADILKQGASVAEIRSAVARLVMSHAVPGVEYYNEGRVPTSREFLLSRDDLFRTDKKNRSCKVADFLKSYIHELIRANGQNTSIAIVFDVRYVMETVTVDNERSEGSPDSGESDREFTTVSSPAASECGLSDECTPDLLGKLCLYEKVRFEFPVFINPRHPYYFQTLVQQYVVSQYYIRDHADPERIQKSDLPSVKLVSAIFRYRDEDELGSPVYAGGRSFDCEHIPLTIIVTPVVHVPGFVKDAVNTVINNWERHMCKKTSLRIWVPNAVNEYLVSSAEKPKTP